MKRKKLVFEHWQTCDEYTDYEAEIDGLVVRITLVDGGTPYLTVVSGIEESNEAHAARTWHDGSPWPVWSGK